MTLGVMYATFVTIRARTSSDWYFDNRYSRHFTKDRSFFTAFKDFNGVVTFRDGNTNHVRGKGSVILVECPRLNEDLYVEALKKKLGKYKLDLY